MKIFTKIWSFFKEVKGELRKVTWPTKKDTVKYTLIVIGVSLGVAFFLGFWDFILGYILNKFVI